MWYKFTAYNSQTLYGWTQHEAIAEAYLEGLNKWRDVNVYAVTALSDSDDEDDGSGRKLSDRSDHVFDDDTTLDDVRDKP